MKHRNYSFPTANTNLQKKRTLHQNLMYELKFIFDKLEGAYFKYNNS